jgi:hypothetical protein
VETLVHTAESGHKGGMSPVRAATRRERSPGFTRVPAGGPWAQMARLLAAKKAAAMPALA